MALALFDLDNTLLDGDSDHAWGEFLCELGVLDASVHLDKQAFFYQQYLYSKFSAGLLWTAGVLVEIAVFIYGSHLFRRFELPKLLCFTFFTAAVRWFLLSQYPQVFGLLVFSQLLHGVTYGLYHATMIQLVSESFSFDFRNRGQAIYDSITMGAGAALGNVLSGYIWEQFGGPNVFLVGAILMTGVALVSILLLPRFAVYNRGC